MATTTRLPQNTYTVVNDVLTYVESEDTARIPLINIALFKESNEIKHKVAEALNTCYSSGECFAMLEGTSIPQDAIDEIFSTYREFYRKSEEEKMTFALDYKDDLGYKIISRNVDNGIIQEYFNYGLTVPDTMNTETTDPYYTSKIGKCFFDHTGTADEMENRWPKGHPDTIKLRHAIEKYYDEMEKLSLTVWEAFALALDLPIDYFINKQKRHISHLQVNNYPSQHSKPPEGVLRIKAHFDVNAFSILLNDEDGTEEGSQGRLQVLNRQNEWKNLPIQPGAFIVNIGELLHRWTNGAWKNVVHRVTNPTSSRGKPRITLGYFAFPDYDIPIEPLSINGPPRYEKTTCGEHSRTGRRYAAEFYKKELMDKLRLEQGLYEEGEQEVDAFKIGKQSRL